MTVTEPPSDAFYKHGMSYPQRHSSPTQIVAGERTFFITSCIWGRRGLLQSDRAASLFVQTIRDYQTARRFRLHAFVVMPDNFHLLITVSIGMTVERAVQFVKGGFAYRAGKDLGFTAPVWQKGFSEVRVLDAEAFKNRNIFTTTRSALGWLTGRKCIRIRRREICHKSIRLFLAAGNQKRRLKAHLKEDGAAA